MRGSTQSACCQLLQSKLRLWQLEPAMPQLLRTQCPAALCLRACRPLVQLLPHWQPVSRLSHPDHACGMQSSTAVSWFQACVVCVRPRNNDFNRHPVLKRVLRLDQDVPALPGSQHNSHITAKHHLGTDRGLMLVQRQQQKPMHNMLIVTRSFALYNWEMAFGSD